MSELTPEQRMEILRRRHFRSDGDGGVHRPSNLDIHHKDRSRNHNEPENLRVLTKEEHIKLHKRAGY
jgi:hypothetical protein